MKRAAGSILRSQTILILAALGFLFPDLLSAQQDRSVDSAKVSAKRREKEEKDDGLLDQSAPLNLRSTTTVPSAPPAGAGQNGISFRGGRAAEMFNGAIGSSTISSPTLGATIGGAKDIGYTRQIINSGKVPQFIDFSPEGLYSEHDIPTPASDCNEPLCLSLGYGYAPTVDDQSNALFLHLGLGSNISVETFKRPALQLAVVVDRSGSMGNMIDDVKSALRRLAGRLTADDEITIVTFTGEAEMLLPLTRGSNRETILAAIEKIFSDGSTDIESGMKMGYAALDALPKREGAMKRMILFTDEQPNVGETKGEGFSAMIGEYSMKDIGLTLFGIGIDFGSGLAYKLSQTRGANFFFLDSPERIASVFDKEFDYLVTPIAYDLKVRIETPSGMKLKAVYGLPTWKPGSRDAELDIPTVFLSSNRGAIILRYEKDGEGPLALQQGDEIAEGSISYMKTSGGSYEDRTGLRYAGRESLQPGTQFYTHDGMRMAVALTNIYFGLRDGCTLLSEGKRKEALDVITRAKGAAAMENLILQDEGLGNEILLLDKLAENIAKGEAIRTDAISPPVDR